MKITEAGLVGIGTSSPTEKLTVDGALAITGALSDDRTSTAAMDFSSGVTRFVSYGASGTDGAFAFRTASGGASSTERVRINHQGNISFGAQKQDPNISQFFNGITGNYGSGLSMQSNGYAVLGLGNNFFINSSTQYQRVLAQPTQQLQLDHLGNFLFQTAASGTAGGTFSFSEKMRLDVNGNLLINQTSSALTYGKLQVSAGGETAGHGGIVAFFDTDGSVASSNLIQLLSFSGDTDATGGQFIRFRDSNSVMGSVSAASGTTVAYNTSSDRRMKENIVDAVSQLDVINNIQIREFDWKNNGHHEVGVIAQELNEVIPNVVQEGGDDVTEEPWGVDYGKLTPYLVKAIQEQQTQIDALQSEINLLKGE